MVLDCKVGKLSIVVETDEAGPVIICPYESVLLDFPRRAACGGAEFWLAVLLSDGGEETLFKSFGLEVIVEAAEVFLAKLLDESFVEVDGACLGNIFLVNVFIPFKYLTSVEDKAVEGSVK